MTAAPPPAAWDLALAGIAELGQKIDALAKAQESALAQAVQDRQNTFATTTSLERRVYELERGATAAILNHLAADVADRAARRARVDWREWTALIALIGLFLALIALIGVLIWLGVR